MYKILVIIMIVLWVGLIAIAAVNMYNQYLVGQQNTRILKAYQYKAETRPTDRNVQDSLYREIAQAESLANALIKPFPIKSIYWNWLILRLTMIFMTIVTIILMWLHYKKGYGR